MIGEETGDVRLLQRARAGEESAFLALYRKWQGSIYRFCMRMNGSESMAEDVTQEVFLALLDGASRFDAARGSFSAYIYGIARNHILRRLARERRHALLEHEGEDKPGSISERALAPGDPLGELTRKEMVESLHKAIALLPVRYREVIVLCELQELEYAGAARVIGCPEGTIRSRLHRARLLLIDRLRSRTKEESEESGIEPARCLL